MKLIAKNIQLSVADQSQPLLSSVSLQILPGQLHVILGPNGAGKSTLFAVLSGSITPDSGLVTINDKNIASMAPIELSSYRAVLPQAEQIAFSINVREVIELGLYRFSTQGLCRRSSAYQQTNHDKPNNFSIDNAVQAAAEKFMVNHLLDRDYLTLSGGEKQRVHLARVFAQNCDLILLDEPIAALDLAHQFHVLEQLKASAKEGKAIAVVIHDINLALRFADHITLIKDGQIHASDRPDHVINSSTVENVYRIKTEIYRDKSINCMQLRVL
ncbi:MAG: ATP-binding cassette domain-containing protein [Pseudomonadota bacterium]|nr:ATP-binding cassette domain-containing protein [Pseudomonadota bacterium]